MKNKITRSLIVFVLLCVTVIMLTSFCACQKDEGDTQPSGDQPRKDIPHYDSIPTEIARIYFNDYGNWDYSYEKEMVTSLSQLKEFNILGTSYSEEYFQYYVICLIPFWYASSDDKIEFIDFAIKDDKFYPIFATNSPIANEYSTADARRNLYVVEVTNRVLDYEFQDILVINRRDVNFGSKKYKSITSVFE